MYRVVWLYRLGSGLTISLTSDQVPEMGTARELLQEVYQIRNCVGYRIEQLAGFGWQTVLTHQSDPDAGVRGYVQLPWFPEPLKVSATDPDSEMD